MRFETRRYSSRSNGDKCCAFCVVFHKGSNFSAISHKDGEIRAAIRPPKTLVSPSDKHTPQDLESTI